VILSDGHGIVNQKDMQFTRAMDAKGQSHFDVSGTERTSNDDSCWSSSDLGHAQRIG